MAKIFFSPAAEKDWKRLPRPVQEKAEDCLARLSNDPRDGKPLHGPLRGFFVYRFEAGGTPYRIAYEIIGGNVVILMIASRDNFYKKFDRRTR